MADYATSADGTRIAYDREGEGPPVILVAGAFQFRAFDPDTTQLVSALAARGVSAIHYDRRGRGETRASPPFTLASEIADLAALIDVAGGQAALYGSSSGSAISLAAAASGLPATRLALWEAPLAPESGDESSKFLQGFRAVLAEGDPGRSVEYFMKDMPPEWLAGAKQSPAWPVMKSVAATLEVDAEAIAWTQSAPRKQLWAGIRVPVLAIVGEQTLPIMPPAAESIATSVVSGRVARVPGAHHRWELDPMADLLAEFVRG